MKSILLKDVLEAVQGKAINIDNKELDNLYITSISIDSRDIQYGSLFVPISGENVDGHNFISSSIEKGAICALSERLDVSQGKIIYVKSTVKALGDLAKFYLSQLDIKIIAITGSVGKTTTKDMVASVMMQKYNVLKTDGNYNNEIGLPLTVFKITDEHEFAILEMGMSEFGEIDYLSKITHPNVAIITNIGISHIENLGSREGIFKAKSEIFDNMDTHGIAILNEDDDMLIKLKDKLNYKILWFGIENKSYIYADNINVTGLKEVKCSIHFDNNIINISIPSPGKHMIYSAMVAIATGLIYNVDLEDIKTGIEKFKSSKMRMSITDTKSKITIINDVYNASPQSMKVALDVLKNSGNQRKVAILGDMFELGDCSKDSHMEVGKYAVDIGIDLVVCIGKLGLYIYNGAKSSKMKFSEVVYFENQENFQNKLLDLIRKYDTILVKASRGMHFEQTVDKIEKVEL